MTQLDSPPVSVPARPADEIRELRRRLAREGDGGVEVDRAELVARLAPGREAVEPDGERNAARYAQRLLMFHGLRARPRVDDLRGERTTVVLDRGLAVQGALVVTVLAALVGAAGSPLYGVLLGVAGLVGTALAAFAFGALDRRAPAWLPRGRTLGAAVAVPLVVAMFFAAVVPIRASRAAHHDNPAFAAALLQGAREALKVKDVDRAEDRVVQASFADPDDPDLDNVRSDVLAARIQAMLDEQARKEGIYARAERAYRAGRRGQAVALMAQIKGFRDADARLADYRAGRR